MVLVGACEAPPLKVLARQRRLNEPTQQSKPWFFR